MADVLVADGSGFEVNEDKAFEDAVIKDEVDVEVGVVEGDAVLLADEGKAFAEFEEKLFEFFDQALFEFTFFVIAFGEVEEFEDIGVFDNVLDGVKLLSLLSEGEDFSAIFAKGDSFKQGGVFLAFEFADGPIFFEALLLVEGAGEVVGDGEEFGVVGPA